jgi:signal transduction histidine kinase
MKLTAHYNRASIIASVFVLVISAVVYYLVINHIARQQLDNDLGEELEEVMTYINVNHHLPAPVDFDEDLTTFVKTNRHTFDTHFCDEPYKNPHDAKTDDGRAVIAMIKFDGQNYIVTIVESRENTEYLIQIITVVTLLLIVVLLLVMIVTNRLVLKGLWRPFYRLLTQVVQFNMSGRKSIIPVNAKADEFREMSDAIVKMATRVTGEYEGLKTFTENASHEMMTPLAVITSKLDMLIQDESLNDDQLLQITAVYQASRRLARLNNSLLLLIKIENDLMPDMEDIEIDVLILEKLQQFNEMIQDKQIEVSYNLAPLKISASKYLADIFINNLFSNAIRHNVLPGRIEITLVGSRLVFTNTGEAVPLNSDVVFERFYKGGKSEGTGLGLAILKNICALYSWNIHYKFEAGSHSFIIDFGMEKNI